MSRVDGHPFNVGDLLPVDYASAVVVGGVRAAEHLKWIAGNSWRPIFHVDRR
jgi:hypothetical protein